RASGRCPRRARGRGARGRRAGGSGRGRSPAGLDAGEDAGGDSAADLAQVVLVLQDDAERVVHDGGVERLAVEGDERGCPVERLRDSGQLVELGPPELLHEGGDLPAELGGGHGDLGPYDRELRLERRVVDPVVEAAALEGVVDLARAV